MEGDRNLTDSCWLALQISWADLCNQRIKNIVQDYPNRNIMQYLRGLAHNISMWRTLLLMFLALCHPKTAFLKATKWPKFAITMHYLCTYLYFVKFVLVYIVTSSPYFVYFLWLVNFVTCKLCTFMFWKFCYLGGVIVRGVFVLGG